MENRLVLHRLTAIICLAITIAACNASSVAPSSKLASPDCRKNWVENEAKTILHRFSGVSELDCFLYELVESVSETPGYALLSAYEYLASDSFSYVEMDYVDIAAPDSEWSIRCALEMARTHEGNCFRYAALMCWSARALGYDAEAVSGVALLARGWAPHAWVEVRLNGEAYIIDVQQHARSWNEGRDFFMVTYDEAPLYYRKSMPHQQIIFQRSDSGW